MGFIGKMLVAIHAALSIAVLAWAGGVYTQRINWNTPPASANKDGTVGVFERQKAKAEQYSAAADKAYTRWSGNLNQVNVLEAERYPRRTFYIGQLNLAETGKFGGMAVAQPFQELVLGANGYLDIRNPTGRKAFEVRPGEPADSIDGYTTKMKKLVEDIAASQVANEQAVTAREKLNREIVGVTQPKVEKGLRTLLLEQKIIYDKAHNEDMYVVDFVTNREAEFGLLKKRRDAMTGRIVELEDYYGKNPAEIPPGVKLKND